MKGIIAIALCAALAAPGCATGRSGPRVPAAPPTTPAAASWVKGYAAAIPIGSPVRVSRFDEPTIRGALVDVTDSAILVQRRTRVPEPPLTVPMQRLRSIEIERPSGNIAKSIIIGAAAGAGAALGLLAILATVYSD